MADALTAILVASTMMAAAPGPAPVNPALAAPARPVPSNPAPTIPAHAGTCPAGYEKVMRHTGLFFCADPKALVPMVR